MLASGAEEHLISHSHTTSTDHPASSKAALLRISRSTLDSNFFAQKSPFVLGVVAYLHPGCRCQKQPCTNIQVINLGSTISGLPGRSLR